VRISAPMSMLLVLALCGSVPACIDSACSKAIPVLTSAQAYVTEALAACDQAEFVVNYLTDTRSQIAASDALNHARSALREASSRIATGSTSCSSPDIGVMFQAFAVAWNALRPFLSAVGGDGSRVVEDPDAYLIGMGNRP